MANAGVSMCNRGISGFTVDFYLTSVSCRDQPGFDSIHIISLQDLTQHLQNLEVNKHKNL